MKHFKILWICVKALLHLPIYRIDVLNWVEYWYLGQTSGLCAALDTAIDDLWLSSWPAMLRYFPKYKKEYAQMFPCDYIGELFWWEPHTWDTNGRLGFFYWLKEQYKDDKTNLRKITIG